MSIVLFDTPYQLTLTTEELNNEFLIATDHKKRTIRQVAANFKKLFFREFM